MVLRLDTASETETLWTAAAVVGVTRPAAERHGAPRSHPVAIMGEVTDVTDRLAPALVPTNVRLSGRAADAPTPERATVADAGRAGSATFGRYPDYTRDRLAHFAVRLAGQVYPQRREPASVGVAGPMGRVTPAEAVRGDFAPLDPGRVYGPLWATYWFRVDVEVPREWAGSRVDFHWSSNSEALLWVVDGEGRFTSVQGFNPGQQRHPPRTEARLLPSCAGGEALTLYVEMACNRMLGVDDSPGRPLDPAKIPPFVLRGCEVRRFDPRAWALLHDFDVLRQLEADANPPQTPRNVGGRGEVVRPALDRAWQGRLLRGLNDVCNLVTPEDPATWDAARPVLDDLLAARNGTVAHEMTACGHAHIDTAWLWPLAETHRKCQRTFSSVLAYMDRYPEFVFACPQAYQYRAISRDSPELFARIRRRVDEGRWVPVGGSWVEPDCNIPSGEAMCRQFLYGQQYFERELGGRSDIFWNPDVFGYNAQLPQLMRHAVLTRFLTQKLSWNRFTSPLHHTFLWRGLDGSEVLTHFPPADTYGGTADVEELRYHAANYKDADRSADALYLFGLGDGGGGPSDVMLERLGRCGDLQGVPRVTQRTPGEFFDRLEAGLAHPPVIEGELYFELHRGTLTSQSEIKRLNRRCEQLLQELEFACVASPGRAPTREAVGELWRDLLLQQFHDILPGSSIDQVNQLAVDTLRRVEAEALAHRGRLLGETKPGGTNGQAVAAVPINTLAVPRREVVADEHGQVVLVEAGPLSAGARVEPRDAAVGRATDDGFVLENARLRVQIDRDGVIRGLFDKTAGREALAGPANELMLFDDRPGIWDAWDVDPHLFEKPLPLKPATSATLRDGGPLRASVTFDRPIGQGSFVRQVVALDAEADAVVVTSEVDWHERHAMLKVGVHAAVRTASVTAETCFGAVERATHRNTIADVARFEVPCHRWADVSEFGYGLAVLNDGKYGLSARGGQMLLSLLRGPTYPDPEADQGRHRVTYAIKPHTGDWRQADVPEHAARLNRPVVFSHNVPAALQNGPLLEVVDGGSLLIDTVKPAEDGDGVVVRCYESRGGRGVARIGGSLAFAKATLSNTLEDDLGGLPVEDGRAAVPFGPFQIITIRLRP